MYNLDSCPDLVGKCWKLFYFWSLFVLLQKSSFCFAWESPCCLFPTWKESKRSPLFSLPPFLQQLAAIFHRTSTEEFSQNQSSAHLIKIPQGAKRGWSNDAVYHSCPSPHTQSPTAYTLGIRTVYVHIPQHIFWLWVSKCSISHIRKRRK